MQRHLTEVLVSAAGPSSAGQGSGTVTIHDLNTGSSLLTLKQNFSAPHASVATETRDGQGGLILSAQIDKGLMNVYSYQKDQLHLRIVLPEKLTCIAVDNTGDYCAGGTQNGRIYLWEMASGIMFNSWEAHYRRIGVVKFTQDGGALVTGSDDATVAVWSMASLLDSSLSTDIPNAYYTLTDHTLPITDLVCGVGAFPRCRILTSSLDNSCKIIDLATKSLLSTFQFPHPITSIVMDATERVFFAASPDGQIHQVNLFRPRKDKISQRDGAASMEAVGGGGHGSAEMIALEEDAEKKRLISVGNPVNCMTISLTTSLLIVGTTAARILVYDIKSHQLIRTINCAKEFVVNSLQVMLKPQDLMGHATIGAAKNDSSVVPIRSVTAFQRTRDSKTREAHEVPILLRPTAQQPWLNLTLGPSHDDFMDDYRYFTNPALSTSSTAASLSSATSLAGPAATARITELERELATVRAQLTRAKQLNTSLYDSALTAIIGDKKPAGAGQGSKPVTDPRPSKRGRVD